MGVAAGLRSTIVSDENRAVVLVDCVGYSNGFEFTISYRSRDPIPRGLLGIEADREISVRIEYSNGRSSTSRDRVGEGIRAYYQAAVEGKVPQLPAGPVVVPQRGGGGGNRYEWRYWCWPLPPDGPIKVTAEWRAAGIGPATVEIDATPIRRAGLSSTQLWNG